MSDLRERLKIAPDRLEEINQFLLDPHNELINRLIKIVEKYGGPEEINRKAAQARDLETLKGRLREEVEKTRDHPTDILDYFMPKEEILKQGIMGAMEQNYLDKHEAVNATAEALTKAGIDVVCARNLHR